MIRGHSPEPEWRRRGFGALEAARWREAGFDPEDAHRWRIAGVYRPNEARQWRTARVTSLTVDRLLRAGMTPTDAVRWHELGYSPAEAADRHLTGERPHPRRGRLSVLFGRRTAAESTTLDPDRAAAMYVLMKSGLDPRIARAYVDAGWSGTTAVGWAKREIPPADAAVLAAIGISPGRAATLVDPDRPAISIVLSWWSAGFTPEEVQDWMDAGFDLEAARDYRRRGIPVKQARALRASA